MPLPFSTISYYLLPCSNSGEIRMLDYLVWSNNAIGRKSMKRRLLSFILAVFQLFSTITQVSLQVNATVVPDNINDNLADYANY